MDNSPPPGYFVEVYGRVVINSFNVLDVRDQVLRLSKKILKENLPM